MSQVFGKTYVKATFLLKKLLYCWFDEIFSTLDNEWWGALLEANQFLDFFHLTLYELLSEDYIYWGLSQALIDYSTKMMKCYPCKNIKLQFLSTLLFFLSRRNARPWFIFPWFEMTTKVLWLFDTIHWISM